MATDRYHVCVTCHKKEWALRLFDALRDFALGKQTYCSECSSDTYLELEFQFGLGRYPTPGRVLAAFLPRPLPRRWREGRYMRAFYPFLVIIKSKADGRQCAWLPYWHVDESPGGRRSRPKYGQWAPFMTNNNFRSLVRQAKARGYRI